MEAIKTQTLRATYQKAECPTKSMHAEKFNQDAEKITKKNAGIYITLTQRLMANVGG
jgi:hypothetical protein